jgi:spheroidene monooxygenase
MATFSVWESVDGLNAFAYQQKNHVSAIKLTRELNWYKEELFSRFQPYDTEGNWLETLELKALINQE